MSAPQKQVTADEMVSEIRSLARPLTSIGDLDPLVDRVRDSRFVCVGEASHGTHEFYHWRAALSRRLIEEHGFTWMWANQGVAVLRSLPGGPARVCPKHETGPGDVRTRRDCSAG